MPVDMRCSQAVAGHSWLCTWLAASADRLGTSVYTHDQFYGRVCQMNLSTCLVSDLLIRHIAKHLRLLDGSFTQNMIELFFAWLFFHLFFLFIKSDLFDCITALRLMRFCSQNKAMMPSACTYLGWVQEHVCGILNSPTRSGGSELTRDPATCWSNRNWSKAAASTRRNTVFRPLTC